MEKNIRNIRNEFKKNGIFYTTTELAETLKSYVDYKPHRVYDPTCGQGNLLSVFEDDVPKFGQELFEDELEKARERLSHFIGYCGDTLKDDGFAGKLFDCIVANPPFSIKWEPNENDERFINAPCVPSAGKADYAFMLHILSHLDPKGKAICLEFPGVLYRGQREGIIRQWMVDNNLIERVVHIPGNTFVDTAIATCIIIFNKSKTTTDIVFEDKELNEQKTVSYEQVKENGYNLSVSTYVFKETPKEVVDPNELQESARRGFLQRLKKELDFDYQVCKMEGMDMQPYIEQIYDIVRIYDRNQ